MPSIFAVKPQKLGKSKKEDLTLRGFGGGWNVVDDDTNMEPKYQTELVNFRRTPAGAQSLRFGSNWFADVTGTVTGNIIDLDYFNDRLVVVTTTGQICTVTNAGSKTKIWDAAIAALLPGAPAGWSAITKVDFVPWKDQLIIHNGIDKPIIISAAFGVTYLQDLATGSNVNTPIGKYGCIAANYHCVAGITAALTTIYLSSKGTAGTFPSDPAPNDAISIDVGAYAPSGAPEIIGIAGYRKFLIVFFRGQSLIIELGIYDTAATPNHVPSFQDEMPQFGLINHRCITAVGNDLHFAGYDGMSSAARNLFSGNIDSKFLSDLVEPDWRTRLAGAAMATPFIVYNALEHSTYLFLNDTDGTVLVYQENKELRYKSWAKFKGLRFASGCRSFLGRVFMAGWSGVATRIYQMGNDVFAGEDYSAHSLNDRDANWANSTAYSVNNNIRDTVTNETYKCIIAHTSAAAGTFAADRAGAAAGKWELWAGVDIDFELELPWVDGKSPMRTKHVSHVSIDSRGTAAFTIKAYVDYITSAAAVSMDFVGNEATSGRRSGSAKLYKYPFKFKSMKIEITGATKSKLTIAGIRFLFSKGRFRR